MNWDTETDINKLITFAKPTQRKLILFAVACCKEILHLMTDQRSKDAVIAAELYADNKISKEEIEIARTNAWHAYNAAAAAYAYYAYQAAAAAAAAAVYAAAASANAAANAAAASAAFAASYAANDHNPPDAYVTAHAKQLNILKDIINPNLPTLNPNTLTYNNSIIPKLAKSIYNSQNYQDLPILADILEDAHEYNPLILNHLRSNQTHYKGCWAVDLLGEIT